MKNCTIFKSKLNKKIKENDKNKHIKMNEYSSIR